MLNKLNYREKTLLQDITALPDYFYGNFDDVSENEGLQNKIGRMIESNIFIDKGYYKMVKAK